MMPRPAHGEQNALALSEGVELQHDDGVIGQQQRLDAPAQAAQAQRHHRRPQLGRGGDIAPRRVERD
jgi:hypothetical protein